MEVPANARKADFARGVEFRLHDDHGADGGPVRLGQMKRIGQKHGQRTGDTGFDSLFPMSFGEGLDDRCHALSVKREEGAARFLF
jgi:hypothetical protein